MTGVVLAIVVLGVVYWLADMAAVYAKTRHAKNSAPAVTDASLPPVTVLKPIKGMDGGLYDSLMSFVRQDYPRFELLFGVQSPDDPALPLLERLRAEYPDRDIRIVIASESVGYNPKVNNLVGMIPHARHEFMVISDSNVRVGPDYLRRNVAYFADDRVGLVSNLIRGAGGRGIAARLECLHLNSFVIGNVCLADLLADRQLVVGKSIFFRRSQMEAMGGLEQFANYLAEDYLMGEVYRRNGYKVVVSPYMVDTWLSAWSSRSFLNRHTRWAKLRRRLNPWAYAGELLTNFPFWTLVYAACAGFGSRALCAGGCLWLGKVLGDCLLNRRIGSPLPGSAFLLSPFKDVLIGAIWLLPFLSSTTRWRGNTLRVAGKSLLIPAGRT